MDVLLSNKAATSTRLFVCRFFARIVRTHSDPCGPHGGAHTGADIDAPLVASSWQRPCFGED